MKKTLLLFLVLFALEHFASAQALIQRPIQSSASTCQPSADSTACVFLQVSPQTNTVGVEVSGTFSGTLQFVGIVNSTLVSVQATPSTGGTAVTSTTSTGTWTIPAAGYSFIGIRCSSYTSGVATVSLNPSQAVIAGSGSGAPGATSVGLSLNAGATCGALAVTGSPVTTTGTLNINFTGTNGDVLTFNGSNCPQDSGTLLSSLAPLASPTFTGTVGGITASMVTNAVANNAANVGTAAMTLNMAASTGTNPFVLQNKAGAAPTAAGAMAYDTTAKMTQLSTNDANSQAIGVVAKTSQKNETTTPDSLVVSATPSSVASTYRACVVISVSAATSGVISWTLSWTDSNGAAQANIAQNLVQTQPSGTAAPAQSFTTSAASNYNGCTVFDVNNAGATIIVKWVGGGTTTAKMSATIERIQ